MTPKWPKHRLKLALGAIWGAPRANWILIFNPRVNFWPFLGPLWAPKINQKSTTGPKSGPRDQFLINFCCPLRFYRFFDGFWLVFCSKKRLKQHALCWSCLNYFETRDLHETLYFTGPELCFQFSSFCIFSPKTSNNDTNTRYAKIIKKWCHGGPKIDPSLSIICQKNMKIAKKYRKLRFFGVLFF